MKIYKWAALMELSKREVTLTMRGSHHDLVFILIGGKKKVLCEEACKCCCEKRLTKKGKKKKKESLGGLFLQRIIAEVPDNMVHEETVNLG